MLSRHVLTVSDFQILIKSCSIESRNDPSPKSEVVHETKFSLKISYSTHACLAQLDQHQTCKPVMVIVVSSNPTGGNFILLNISMLILYKNDRNVRFCVFYENLGCCQVRTDPHIVKFVHVLENFSLVKINSIPCRMKEEE